MTETPEAVEESRPPEESTLIAELRLYRNPRAVARGRHVLAGWLSDDPLLFDAQQIVSELLTNAVIHPENGLGRESIVLRASWLDTDLLLEVIDPGPLRRFSIPNARMPAIEAESGRGLGIVRDYARAWGTFVTESGKRNVWAVLSRS
ncbi:Anti-sigma regulatory factor (Ser/Thr protein kinase) [Nonomuraea wenchangensis]|uniref:Anti-sigma regulatory factor (Ser/Thr protein kinase) n=1 Tax=Nonomuraea wenchangensis TaxID=568860 RepID=A0A1I0EGB6_9ACTN|nr:Anti-sigma regulatory factor (Ser/Thr protein kinase) [Nonomuraea wenchangensis]